MNARHVIASIAAGAVVMGAVLLFSPAATVTVLPDGGLAVLYTLPDGGQWGMAPDAAPTVLGVLPAAVGQVDVATATGYQRVSFTALPDGGYTLGTTALPFVCACADDSGTCLFPDGGIVVTGTYPSSFVTGAGCQLRPCIELSGFTGAAAGCQP